MTVKRPPAVVVTVAGSDPSGGAGVQADLRLFAVHGLYGMAVISALTVQGRRGVRSSRSVEASLVRAQLEELLTDYPVAALKTGMLGTAANVAAVADVLEVLGKGLPVVVDPVVRSSSGHSLLSDDGVQALVERLLPLATVVTPNYDEAAALLGWSRVGSDRAAEAAEALCGTGPRAVVVTGGHAAPGELAADRAHVRGRADGNPPDESYALTAPWVDTPHSHGTGCLFSSAICAGLAQGRGLRDSLQHGKDCVTEGLRRAVGLEGSRGSVWLERVPG